MKTLSVIIIVITLAFSLGGKVQAQADLPPQMEEMMRVFQSMTPEQLENMRNMAASIDPEQREAMRERLFSMTPEQRLEVLQQFSADPQKALKTLQDSNDPLREQMGVTNNAEWLIIEARIAAVRTARTALMSYEGGMMGMPGGFGGGRAGMPGRRSPEGQALQEALDSNAPMTQTRTLLARFREARKSKQTALIKTQDDLRAVLTPRQEAIATIRGLLD